LQANIAMAAFSEDHHVMTRLPFFVLSFCFCLGLGPSVAAAEGEGTVATQTLTQVRPVARTEPLPPMRWEMRGESDIWTRSALAALRDHGTPLTRTVPHDIKGWCPAYERAGAKGRRAFWVGLLSALAKHESTYRPDAVGGGGRWYGLLQILPATARGYGCAARTGRALKDGSANLACAIRIMATTVPRDQAIAVHRGRWRGVAADWGPMTSSTKRRDMSAWLRKQPYCTAPSKRPQARPANLDAPRRPVARPVQIVSAED